MNILFFPRKEHRGMPFFIVNQSVLQKNSVYSPYFYPDLPKKNQLFPCKKSVFQAISALKCLKMLHLTRKESRKKDQTRAGVNQGSLIGSFI
jgi:hypothetical protein